MACDSPYIVDIKGRLEAVPVPCGKCPPCKKRRVDSWVFRMQQEDKVSVSSYFVTLTYDEYNVPISKNNFMTLSKRDYQLFFKRLRKLQPDGKIKYYLCGEYGTQFWRPHYHMIIFNVLNYEHLNDAWGLGTVDVRKVCANTMAYCVKYIDKPKQVPLHARDDRLPEFSAMSKGLGLSYLTPARYNFHTDDITRTRVRKEDGSLIPMPRYYRDKIYTDDEKAEQRRHIVAAMKLANDKDQVYFDELYKGDKHIDYHQWSESKKLGRWKSFQKQSSKTRDYA